MRHVYDPGLDPAIDKGHSWDKWWNPRSADYLTVLYQS